MSLEYESTSREVLHASSIGELINSFDEQLSRLEAEAADNPGLKEFPEWYSVWSQRNGIENYLRKDEADLALVPVYFELRRRELALGLDYFSSADDTFSYLAYGLGSEVLGRAFAAEPIDGVLHSSMAEVLERKAKGAYQPPVSSELEVLRHAYGCSSMTELLGVKGEGYEDSLRKSLLSEDVIYGIAYNDTREVEHDADWKSHQSASREWMIRALQASTGMTEEEAADYSFSPSRRASSESLAKAIKQVDGLGLEAVRTVTGFAGIVGLEAYTAEQLERMHALAVNPEVAASKLGTRDVNVVMINRVGDHNGVMESAAAEFDDEIDSRTLFFEIESPADILKYLSRLASYNIRPSTLVISAHGSEGEVVISDERNEKLPKDTAITVMGRMAVEAGNGKPREGYTLKKYSMHGMKGVARVVEKYMQPSRAIDDDEETYGRKRIIFQSCYAGLEVDQKDVDKRGDEITIGHESVISQLAKDLWVSGIGSSVDIYGAPEGIQMHRTERGVRYSGQPISSERTPLQSVRIRIDNNNISKDNVDEIVLRRSGIASDSSFDESK